MNAQSSCNKYRSLEYITNKINTFPNFETYLKSLSINTAKNYKIPLEHFINSKVRDDLKDEYKKILNKKISNIFDNSFKHVNEKLDMILDEIENLYLLKETVLSIEDLIFLLSLISIVSRINLKDMIFDELIKVEENKEVLIINIRDEKKYIIRKRKELFEKALFTLNKTDKSKLVTKKSENQIIHKYFYPKNNCNEKISILTLRKVLEFYFSKTME
ncbi:hypothetical protein ACOTWR_06225 [Aliarcobacter butzleri]|uniref:hypothetical protein n=1 Tax=Aliarcobacter butzleri TaxID=28197 RepID=UPI0021B2B35C|nr:hypothetical protein [Aliarcobacter butzleri]MCT7563173.1 hypothetical protein [Aliarcobacter butzleri]MCT7578648.1 hypothetical protein [Aliarcobacter butzleri]MCT7647589.1 hypothetical protein [Aliarcobacter butzleri]